MNRSILVVGAHADDIEIQTGGLLLKYRDAGYSVVYVMATNNMSGGVSELLDDGTLRTTREGTVDMMERRKRECDDAARVLGTVPIHLDHPQRHYWDAGAQKDVELRYGCALPAGVAPNVPSIMTAQEDPASIKRLADIILEKDPECVFAHDVCAMNVEHFATSLLATAAFWQAVDQGFRGALLHWREPHPRLGEFTAHWDTFIDFTLYLDRKMALIGLHRCQMPKAHLPTFGHRGLAVQWGTACGCGAAEVFNWVRHADIRDTQGGNYPPLILELIRNTR